jgi:hypothetical protein
MASHRRLEIRVNEAIAQCMGFVKGELMAQRSGV